MPRAAASSSARRRPARPSSPSSSSAIARRRAPIEKLRLVSTGTEATMTAIRLARGVDRPRPAREVRRALPRPLRRPARRGGLGRRDARAARLGRRARRRSRRRPSCCPTTTSTPCARRFAAHGDRIAAIIVEAAAANMGVVPPDARLQRARSPSSRTRTARCSSSTRCSPASASAPAGWWGLERGTASAVHARPRHVRQGHRRRPAARRARRPRRRHGAARAARARCTRPARSAGNPVAVAAGRRDAASRATPTVYAHARRGCRDDQRTPSSDALAAEGVAARRAARRATCSRSCSARRGAVATTTTRAGAGGVAVPAVLPRDARRRASRCRRRCSRRGSSPRRTTTRPSAGSWTRCPPPRAPRHPLARPEPRRRRPGVTGRSGCRYPARNRYAIVGWRQGERRRARAGWKHGPCSRAQRPDRGTPHAGREDARTAFRRPRGAARRHPVGDRHR